MRILILALALILNLSALAWGAANLEPRAVPEGEALAARLRLQKPEESRTVAGTFKMRSGAGRYSEITVQMQVIPGVDHWQSIYQTMATNPAAREKVVITHSDQGPNIYLWSRPQATPAGSDPAKPDADQTMASFAGTDFWLVDLGLEFLYWPEQRLLRAEMRRGRSCHVLESINPHPAPGGYVRVISWIDIEFPGIVLAKAYGADQKVIKEFSLGSFKKVGGRWQLKNMEIRSPQLDSRTLLEFNLELN